jgi:hypothetical protein
MTSRCTRYKGILVTLAGTLVVLAMLIAGPVAGAAAAVSIDKGPTGYTQDTTPSFAGGTSDVLDPVTLKIYEDVEAAPVREVTSGAPLDGEWSLAVTPALSDHGYTAIAEQVELLGLSEPSFSSPVTFTVDTVEPAVSLDSIPSPSNDSTPTLSGDAGNAPGDDSTVTVKILSGGKVIASGPVSRSGNRWSTTAPHLSDGNYEALAEQGDAAGNTGTSQTRSFTIDTSSPHVTLQKPPSPSNNTTPAFTGSASDSTQVTVKIYAGGSATGSPVATATAAGSEGPFTSDEASPALASGQYTAVAVQPSSAGNPAGVSAPVTFVVSTGPPTVTLNQPKSPSRDTTPSFTGSASDTTTVQINIYAGTSASGSVVATAAATGTGGNWSSGEATPALPSGTYTAIASQESSLFGNPTGNSGPVTFTVDTVEPAVSLDSIPSPSNDSTPTLSGDAGNASGDDSTVTVKILSGGKVIASGAVSRSGDRWSTTAAHLSDGTYEALAEQGDAAGNTGTSQTRSFKIDTSSPSVTLQKPPSPSNNTTPAFTGFASDSTQVTVKIYAGGSATGSPVATATAVGTGSSWTSDEAGPALASGQYTAVAVQPSSAGNPAGVSAPVTFVVSTGPPTVTLNQPKPLSNDTTPSFSGSASDTTTVQVNIYAGTSASGSVVATAAATGTGGNWSSGEATPALPSGTYTAIASQESSLFGNPTGNSGTVTFRIDTSSPTVTLNQPPALSNDSTPTLSGTASDVGTVSVHILNASTHALVATATATPAGGKWSTSNESALPSGSYTAQATQPSSLGNPAGVSGEVAFAIETNPPHVTLNSPAVRSNVTAPAFSGTASDNTQVTVQVFKGSKAEGTVLATAAATGTGGAWSSSQASPALGNGQYTAIASQSSSLGNGIGRSAPVTFEVDTSSPTVTLNQPLTPSNQTAPTFTGTASDSTTVTVKIYKGPKAEGTPVSTATAAGTNWTSTAASPALITGQYTAVAGQPSSVGNSEGKSAPLTFVVNTASPTVTLNQPLTPSNQKALTFTGTASDSTTVTVRIYKGPKAEGTPVSTATATGTNWTSTATSPELSDGVYTAIAGQQSSVGNAEGKSAPVTFEVDTTSPTVTLVQPKSPSNNTAPVFTGTASGKLPVTIRIYVGATATGSAVSTATATVIGAGGAWSSGAAKPALAIGTTTYTAVATQESPLGNLAGSSKEAVFTVDTTPPKLTLSQPAPLSNDTTPSFAGTATDTTQVSIKIYAGVKAEGSVLATATATGTGAAWTSTTATPALGGKRQRYTAVAVQPSSIGNAPGASNPVTFTVDAAAPTLTLDAPRAQSNNPSPSFSGTTDEATPVTVNVYTGASAGGTPVASAVAPVTSGEWNTGAIAGALPDGRYTAAATQTSHVGNSAAETAPMSFTIDTVAPQVTLLEPADGSSGAGSAQLVRGSAGIASGDLAGVTVQLFSGSSIAPGQPPLQSILVTSIEGAWSTTFVGLGSGSYTVRAQQADSAGNVGTTSTSSFALGVAAGHAATPGAPAASFAWFPTNPRVGEAVSLVSSSSDAASPLVGFAWDLAGTSAFADAGSSTSTTFTTAGKHLVQLRVTDAAGLTSVAGETIAVSAPALPLMQPFPIVRITSIATRSGVRLRLLSVLAPAGAQITVRCTGHACPTKSQSHLAAVHKSRAAFVEFRRFERALTPGAVIEIRVSKAGVTGKYTRFVVRRGKRPTRLDACISGVAPKAIRCPSS